MIHVQGLHLQGWSPGGGKGCGKLLFPLSQGRLNDLIRQASGAADSDEAAPGATSAAVGGKSAGATTSSTAKGVARLSLNRTAACRQSSDGCSCYAKAPLQALRRTSCPTPLPGPRVGTVLPKSQQRAPREQALLCSSTLAGVMSDRYATQAVLSCCSMSQRSTDKQIVSCNTKCTADWGVVQTAPHP